MLPYGPGFDFFDPRLVELSLQVRCPKCGRPYWLAEIVEGRSWFECPHKGDRYHPCDFTWHAFFLPAGATGVDIAAVMGQRAASRVIRHLVPAVRELPDAVLWREQLVAPTAPAYIQIAARARERHLYRHRSAVELLHVLGVV